MASGVHISLSLTSSPHHVLPNSICLILWSATISYLHYSHQTIVATGISQDSKSTCRVSSGHSVHGIPRRRVGLVFIHYRQISHDHIHPVFRYFTIELQRPRKHFTSAAEVDKGHAILNIHQRWGACLSSLELWQFISWNLPEAPRKLIAWFPCQHLPFGLSRIPYLRDVWSGLISILPASTPLSM